MVHSQIVMEYVFFFLMQGFNAYNSKTKMQSIHTFTIYYKRKFLTKKFG